RRTRLTCWRHSRRGCRRRSLRAARPASASPCIGGWRRHIRSVLRKARGCSAVCVLGRCTCTCISCSMSDLAALQRADVTSAAGTAMRHRFVVVATHPIQYYAPLYRALATSPAIDIHVIFCSRAGLETYFDVGFGRELHWKNDLVSGYPCSFLD